MSEYNSDVMQTLQREFAGAKGTKNNLQFLAHKGHDYFLAHKGHDYFLAHKGHDYFTIHNSKFQKKTHFFAKNARALAYVKNYLYLCTLICARVRQ